MKAKMATAGAGGLSTPRLSTRDSEPGRYTQSPLGATPRPALPQKYDLAELNGSVSPKMTKLRTKDNIRSDPTTSVRRPRAYSSSEDIEHSTTSFLLLGLIFIASLLALLGVYLSFPELAEDEKQHIKIPRDIDDAKHLGHVLSRYKDVYYYHVIGGYFITYIFLQSFAIPGSIFLSILSGYLFPFPLAITLVCLCSAVGASFCYSLSYLVGRKLVKKYIPERVESWSQHVDRHREHLLNYIIFLRITPFLPNWFINITAPVISVPLWPFMLGTFLGVAPPSFIAISAGTTLQKLTSSGDALSWQSITALAFIASLSLLPVLFKKRLQKKFD